MGERTNFKCVECNKPFSMSTEEKKWYEEKGFEMPKRCKECRKKRKQNKRKAGDK